MKVTITESEHEEDNQAWEIHPDAEDSLILFLGTWGKKIEEEEAE